MTGDAHAKAEHMERQGTTAHDLGDGDPGPFEIDAGVALIRTDAALWPEVADRLDPDLQRFRFRQT